MRLHKAQVVDDLDLTKSGRFFVVCPELSDDSFEVTYVSPYVAGDGALVAIPRTGTEVLIAQTDADEDKSWYYMGSLFGSLAVATKSSRKNVTPAVSDVYKDRHLPQKVLLRTPRGNEVLLSDEANIDKLNYKAQLKSGLGKKVTLDDSPKTNSIRIWNEHRDGIKITSEADLTSAKRAIEVESKGPQLFLSRESGIDLRVLDGRELNIRNHSTGFRADPNNPEQFGNINIESSQNDVNITVREESGRIFIDALGEEGLIQVESNGQIIIKGTGKLSISSEDSIDMKAPVVRIQGDEALHLRGGIVNMGDSGSSNVLLDGTAFVDGSEVHFNSRQGGVTPPEESDPASPQSNAYGD